MKPADRLYIVLRDIAAKGEACPPSHELGPMVGLASSTVSKVLGRLRDAGLIKVEAFGPRRWVEIVETGHCTADPRSPVVEPEPKKVPERTVAHIARVVARAAMLPLEEILGRSRNKMFIRPRALIYYFAGQAGWGTSHIARMVKRDHTTVGHAMSMVPIWLATDKTFERLYHRVERALEETPVTAEIATLPPIPKETARVVAGPPIIAPSKAKRPVAYNPDSYSEVSFILDYRRGSQRLLEAIKRAYPERCAA